MGLAAGDAFVSGSILSFQQANRIRDNWRGATAPSNPQAGSLFSDSDDEKLYHRQASAWKEIVQVDTEIAGYVDLVRISTLAAGGFAFRIDAYQDDTTALTGLLRGAYIQASNGDEVCTGIIRALELKARAGRPGETGTNVAHLEGLSISADAKTYDITTVMRGAEIILDGAAGSTITKAVGIRIANNFQADIATLCYGLEIYRDSFDYDADIALSSGGLIGGKAGHLRLTDAGILEIYEDAMVDKISLYHDGTRAYLKTNAGQLYIQDNIAQDIKCWSAITSGNPALYIYGYKASVGVKYAQFYIDSSGRLVMNVQESALLKKSGTILAAWDSDQFRLQDDKTLRFGNDSDICMGYLNTGDIWHLCDQATLGSNIRMSINATGLSFFGEAPVAQAGHIGDTGGDDAAVVNAILVVLEDLGLIADA